MALYRVDIGTGLAWLDSYVIETEQPTTDYGALVDVLIDYLKSVGSDAVLDPSIYEWDEDGNIYYTDDPDWVMYQDEFIQGGNEGDVLYHYGVFDMYEISEDELEPDDVIIQADLF